MPVRDVQPLHTFKVYPNPRGRLYFAVKVFKNKSSMRRYGKERSLVGPPWNYGAICIGYSNWQVFPKRQKRAPRLTPLLGEIHFHRNQIGTETISHEAAHAVFRWMRRKGIRIVDDDANHGPRPTYKRTGDTGRDRVDDSEEQSCYALGQVVSQIVKEFYRAGIYSEGKEIVKTS